MKKFLSLVLALIMVLSLAAFSAQAEGLKGEFTVVHYNSESDVSGTAAAYWTAVKAFQEANPDVKINFEFIAHDDYEANLSRLIAGDSLPDVFLTKGDLVGMLADGGKIYAAEELVKEDADWYGQYLAGAFNDGTYNGTGYTIPFQMQANCVVLYNQAIFDECGVAFPTTIQELIDLIPVFTEKGYTTIGLGNNGSWLAPSCIVNTFMYRYVDGEWFNSLREGTGAAWTDEAIVKGLTDFQAIAKAGAFNETYSSLDQDGMYELFYNKKCAMMINGAWMIGSVMGNCPADVLETTKVALLPAVEGGVNGNRNVAAGAGWGWTLNKSLEGDNLQAALAFCKAITTGDYATTALLNGFFSAAQAGEYDPAALSPLFAAYAEVEKDMAFLPIWDVVLPASFGSGEYYATTSELLLGAITPEDMAQRLQDAWEACQD